MGTFIDMTGWIMKEHGVPNSRLTVLERAPNQGRQVCWNCICDCGKQLVIRGDQLRSGIAKSCGCLQREKAKITCSDTGKKNLGRVSVSRIDLTNKKFGLLTALEYSYTTNKKAIWKCKCECGTIVYVSSTHLLSGHTRSCGCTSSFGERKLNQLLNELNISYKKEFTFEDLYDKNNLRFDYAIFNNNNVLICLLEYQGEQHYLEKAGKWQSPKEHDELKRQYCAKHNIKLIEIPYWDYDKIDKNYLMEKIYGNNN